MEPRPAAIVIRAPAPAERRACRMLLPAAAAPGQRCRFWVAAGAADGKVVGAVALGLDPRSPAGRRGWRVDCRVIVPSRGRGVGRALVEHAAGRARAHGVEALHGWEWVKPNSDPARAWAALGFVPTRKKVEFEADLAKTSAPLRRMRDELVERKWIPESARVVPLAEADVDAVADLHVRHLGGNRRLLMPLLRGTAPDRYDPVYSRVLLLGGRVVGFTLGRLLPGGVCEVDANVLHPSVRMGWANLFLKLEAGDRLLEAGVHTLRYFTLEQHTDTKRISRQVGCTVVRELQEMSRDLRPTQPPGTSAPTVSRSGDAGGSGG